MSFRRLLKDSVTGLYFDGKGGWTPNHLEAHAYSSARAAINAAGTLAREELLFIMKFPDERLDVTYPLGRLPLSRKLGDKAKVLVNLSLPASMAAEQICRRMST